jgi:ribonucleoside-diphosphate reductase alpha chain
VSIAFADNASSGIEPAFSWTYFRTRRPVTGTDAAKCIGSSENAVRAHEVQDHAFRLYQALGGDTLRLPPAFVHALEIRPEDHIEMVAAVQPFIDSSIAKTVNLAVDYPFEDFKKLYLLAWSSGLKGLTTYRPNAIRGPVLTSKRSIC